MSRRNIVLLAAILLAASALFAGAAAYRRAHPLPSLVRLGGDAGDESPQGRAVQTFLRLLEERGHGRVVVRPFLDASIGNEETLAPKVQQGVVEAAVLSRPLWRFDPAWQVFDLPWTITDQQDMARLWSQAGPDLEQRLLSQRLVLGSLWSGGEVAVFSRRPLSRDSDWQGLSFFSGPTPAGARGAEALGATASHGALDREREAVRAGAAEAYAAPVALAGTFGPPPPYVLEGYGELPVLLVFSRDWWERQPEDVRQLLLSCARDAAPASQAAARAAEEEARRSWQAAGVKVGGPPPLRGLAGARQAGFQSFASQLSPELQPVFSAILEAGATPRP